MASHSSGDLNSVFTFADQEKILSVEADEDLELLDHAEHASVAVTDGGEHIDSMWGVTAQTKPGALKTRERADPFTRSLSASSPSFLSKLGSGHSTLPAHRVGPSSGILAREEEEGLEDGSSGGHWIGSWSSGVGVGDGEGGRLGNTIPGLQIQEDLPLPPFFFSGLDFPIPPPLHGHSSAYMEGEKERKRQRWGNGTCDAGREEGGEVRHPASRGSVAVSLSSLDVLDEGGARGEEVRALVFPLSQRPRLEGVAPCTVATAFGLLFGPAAKEEATAWPKEDTEQEKDTASSSSRATSGASSSVVLPCVSLHCRMMVSASKGSAALRDLFQLQAIERKNKDVMDTSASSLTILLHRPVHPGTSSTTSPNSRPSTVEVKRDHHHVGPQTEEKKTQRTEEEEEKGKERLRTEGTLYPLSQLLDAKEGKENKEEKDKRWNDIQRVRKTLPIYACKEELLRVIGENPVTIVVGETGSGKTTQLVQYLYEAGYTKNREEGKQEEIESSRREAGKGSKEDEDTLLGVHDSSNKRTPRICHRIACTQPRRLAAVGVARRVSEEVGCPVGSTVGYSIHLDDTTSADTHIQFMTDGLLLRHLTRDPDLLDYSVIMLDEAHERSMDTDVLMGVLKAIVKRREGELKLIVASATLDADKFSRFFHHAPCFYIPGRMFTVKEIYTPDPVADYVAEAVFRVCQLHLQTPLTGVVSCRKKKHQIKGTIKGIKRRSGAETEEEIQDTAPHPDEEELEDEEEKEKFDILVFMSGKDDVMGTCELIHRRLSLLNPEARRTLLLLPCLSEGGASLSVRAMAAPPASPTIAAEKSGDPSGISPFPIPEDKGTETGIPVGVLDPTPAGFRKCVVATNVAETSLTIDGIRYVIDAGFMKTTVYRPSLGMNTLQRYPISRAQGGQRKGRAGRTAEGVCFRLYTERQWEEEMLPQSVPELQRSSMDSVVLLLKSVLDRGGHQRNHVGSGEGGGGELLHTSEEEVTWTQRGEDRRLALPQGKTQERKSLSSTTRTLLPWSSSSSSSYAQWMKNREEKKKRETLPPSLREFEFIDPPPPVTIQRSMWTLYLMGFLDPVGRITSLGRQALDFPMSPLLAKLVLEGGIHHCLTEVCQIVAMLCADPKHLFEVPKGKEEVAHRQHGMFKVLNSDHLTYLYVYTEYIGHGGGSTKMISATTREWTRKHFLHLPTLQRAVEIFDQVMERARHIFRVSKHNALTHSQNRPTSTSGGKGVKGWGEGEEGRVHRARNENDHERGSAQSETRDPSSSTAASSSGLQDSMDRVQRWERVRRCLAHSFFLQSAQRSGDDWSLYRPLFHAGVASQLHPRSSIGSLAETPMYVVYHDLLSLTVTQQQSTSEGAGKRTSGVGGQYLSYSSVSSPVKKDNREAVSVHKEYLMVVTAVEPEWLVEASQGIIEWRDPVLRRRHQEDLKAKKEMEKHQLSASSESRMEEEESRNEEEIMKLRRAEKWEKHREGNTKGALGQPPAVAREVGMASSPSTPLTMPSTRTPAPTTTVAIRRASANASLPFASPSLPKRPALPPSYSFDASMKRRRNI